MIKIENTTTSGWEEAIRGMRNPMNSWDKLDSTQGYRSYILGKNDLELALKLAKAGGPHAKFRRMITVYTDVTAPLYWWKEYDTYKVGTVANSCSTMHKIHSRELTFDDFSHEHLYDDEMELLRDIITTINSNRKLYLDGKRKEDWWQIIQLLPSSYNQKRTLMLNYEVLSQIHTWRKDHKLDEWRDFCKWIERLPYHELITCGKEDFWDD